MSDIELIYNSLKNSLPPGIFWIPLGDFKKILEAISELQEPYYEKIKKLADLKSHDKTTLLNDIADEYGIDVYSNLTENEIRLLINTAQLGCKDPGVDCLQNILIKSGFNVLVHRNSPYPTSPFTYIGDAIPFMCDGNEKSCDGNEEAIDGNFPGGELLINGSVISTLPLYTSVDGNETMCDGNELAVEGYFTEVEDRAYSYRIPLDSSRWNQIYFVGGDATRDPVTKEITGISEADIPLNRKNEFENIILKYGPADGWAGIVINYI